MRIEPKEYMNEDQKKGVKPKAQNKRISTGKKVLAPVGYAFKRKGDRKILEVAYVCIKDLEKRREEGAVFIDRFIIAANMQWKIF